MKINQFSKLFLVAGTAVFLLTLTTSVNVINSPMQPAYSQATHCAEGNVAETEDTFERCITPGKDPVETFEICVEEEGCTEEETEVTGREAGIIIGQELHRGCSQDPNVGDKLDNDQCTVDPPDNDND